MIHIIDYGLGNVQAFVNLYKRLGVETVRAKSRDEICGATRLVLPGVGAFDHAIRLFTQSGMRATVERLVLNDKVPVLGVCVGMQMLADSSEEGVEQGLGWINGRVRSFSSNHTFTGLPMPHMGWNDVEPAYPSPLFKGLEAEARFYFLHSYYFECANQVDSLAHGSYGLRFACAIQRGNIFGVQFHPEKSHHWGTALLKNFAEL